MLINLNTMGTRTKLRYCAKHSCRAARKASRVLTSHEYVANFTSAAWLSSQLQPCEVRKRSFEKLAKFASGVLRSLRSITEVSCECVRKGVVEAFANLNERVCEPVCDQFWWDDQNVDNTHVLPFKCCLLAFDRWSPFGNHLSSRLLSSHPSSHSLSCSPSFLPPPEQPSLLPSPEQPSLLPPPKQPSLLPSPEQPSLLPPSEQLSLLPPLEKSSLPPPPEQLSFLPSPEKTSILPPTEQPSLLPPPEQPSLIAPPEQPSLLPPISSHPSSRLLSSRPSSRLLRSHPSSCLLSSHSSSCLLSSCSSCHLLSSCPSNHLSSCLQFHPSSSDPPPHTPLPTVYVASTHSFLITNSSFNHHFSQPSIWYSPFSPQKLLYHILYDGNNASR